MKKRFLAIIPATVLATGLMLLTGISHAKDDGGLATLRGSAVSATEKAPTGDGMKKALEAGPTSRNFLDQPPLIGHAIDDYAITLNQNKCMECHSQENYKKEKTTMVSKTHFKSATGETLAKVSSRHHFCTQCHVPQIDAKPLVQNTFQRAK